MRRSYEAWRAFLWARHGCRWVTWTALTVGSGAGLVLAAAISKEWSPGVWKQTLAAVGDTLAGFLMAAGLVIGGIVGCGQALFTEDGRKAKGARVFGGLVVGGISGAFLSVAISILAALLAVAAVVLIALATGAVTGSLAELAIVLLVWTVVILWRLTTNSLRPMRAGPVP